MITYRITALFLSFLALNLLTSSWMHAQEATEPTNAKEAAELNKVMFTLPPAVQAADAKRKAAMNADELAWERTLESSLGGYYLPEYKKNKAAGKETAWDYVKEDPKLPRLLIIGDSISRGYTVPTRHVLQGQVNVHRAPENCGPTRNALSKFNTSSSVTHLDVWLGKGKWDVIHVNFGIHDRATNPATYKANLLTLIKQLKATGAKIIWARTTPNSPAPTNASGHTMFTAQQCQTVNEIADQIMKEQGIVENDLYATIEPHLKELQRPGDVHFQDEGYEIMGKQVAKSVLAALGR